MVDGMVLRKREKTDRGHLEHAAKINRFGQLLPAQAFNLLDIGIETLIKPCSNLGGVVDGVRPIVGREIKLPRAYAAQKAMLRRHNVPCQLQRALGYRLRT